MPEAKNPAKSKDDKCPSKSSTDGTSTATRRGHPQCDGIYFEGKIQRVKATICVDTGASSTIISTRAYQDIPDAHKPKLRPARPHTTADGKSMVCEGRGIFDLQFSQLELKAEIGVAPISEDMLMGADLLQGQPSGPEHLLLSEGRMILNGISIPLTFVNTPNAARQVYAADHYVVPGMCEMVIDVYVDRNKDDDGDQCLLIEPMAKSLPDANFYQTRYGSW